MLENIYVDFEIASGYALVIKDEEENNEISLEYQIIVSTGLFMSGRAEYPHSLELAGATYYLPKENYNGSKVEVFVNGEKYNPTELVTESGKYYFIKEITTVTDAQIDLGYILLAF